MKKYIIIKADTNDGDYVTKKSEISDKLIEELKPIIAIINEQHGDWSTRWEVDDEDELAENVYKNVLTEDQIELFNDYVPNSELGVHTIESIEILEVANEIKLL